MKRTSSMILLALALCADADAWARGGRGGAFAGRGYAGGGYAGGGYRGAPYYRGGFHGGYYPGRVGVGFYFGQPWYSPWYFGPPPSYYYPYYAPTVVVPATPPVYIEQGGAQPASADWKYCQNAQGYYPYIQECPSGWQSVPPQPEGQEPNHWYYCDAPRGYYPYARECPAGWQKVPPQPAPEK